MRILSRLDGWWMAPLGAQPVAFFRVALGLYALIYLISYWPNLTSSANFEATQFEPIGVATFAGDPLAGWLVHALVLAAIGLSVAFTLGWRHTFTGPLFAFLLLWVFTYRNSWGQIYHTENLLVLHAIVLGFARSADDLSLDARRGPVEAPDTSNYGWPLRLCAVLTVLTYFLAGWAKLEISGLEWITSDAMRNHVAYDNLRYDLMGSYDAPLGVWLLSYGWIFKPLAVATLIVELGAPLALLNRRIALVWAATVWFFHLGVLATMVILFPYPLVGLAFLPLFNWDGEPIIERIRRIAQMMTSWMGTRGRWRHA